MQVGNPRLMASVLIAALLVGCAGRSQDRFASPVAPLAGCYAFEYGPWPEFAATADSGGWPDPEALPAVVELRAERVGATDEPSIDGRIHEVRTHGRPGRGILHYWRMVDSDSFVIWTGGPTGFRLEVSLRGREAEGIAQAYSIAEREDVITAPLSGVRAPCPRQAVRRS